MKQNVTLTHGGDWAGFAAQYGPDAPLLDCSANVSPLGLPEGVARALTSCADRCTRYPDPLCRALREDGTPLPEESGESSTSQSSSSTSESSSSASESSASESSSQASSASSASESSSQASASQ